MSKFKHTHKPAVSEHGAHVRDRAIPWELVDAAPEMLEALRWAERMICGSLSIADQALSHGLKDLRAVIAKAEGRK